MLNKYDNFNKIILYIMIKIFKIYLPVIFLLIDFAPLSVLFSISYVDFETLTCS